MVFCSSSPNGPRRWSTLTDTLWLWHCCCPFHSLLAGFRLFQASHLQYYSWRGDTELTLYNPAAAAAAKSLQLCPILCDRIDSSPPASCVPGILQARILEWVAFPSPIQPWRNSKKYLHVRPLNQIKHFSSCLQVSKSILRNSRKISWRIVLSQLQIRCQ